MRVARLTMLLLFCASTVCAQQAQRLTIVLSGGGARGLAQVGALKQLEEQGIRPDVIVGSSFGAIVGGLYAAGYTASELDSIFREVDWESLTSLGDDIERETLFFSQKAEDDRSIVSFRFRDFSFLPPTAIGGSARFASQLQELLWNSPYNSESNFDSLRIVFRAVATDLALGTWVSLSQGNLATALQASAMFPLRYSPVKVGGRVLVDGGLVANIPVRAAMELDPGLIVVINTVSELAPAIELRDAFDVADQSLSVAMKQMDTTYLNEADFVIRPDVSDITTFQFDRVGEIIDRGYIVSDSIIREIKRRIQKSPTEFSSIDNPGIQTISVTGPATAPVDNIQVSSFRSKFWSANVRRDLRTSILRQLRALGESFTFVRSLDYDVVQKSVVVVLDDASVRGVGVDSLRSIDFDDMRSELAFELGDSLSHNALKRTADNLRASDLFDDVDLTVNPAPDTGVEVIVGATDRGNQSLKLGARIDNERFTQVAVDFIHQKLFNSNIRVDLGGYISQRIGLGKIQFEVPRIGGALWTASLSAYASFRKVWFYEDAPDQPRAEPEKLRTGEFSEDRLGLRLGAGRQLERNGVILAEFRYEQQRYRDLAADKPPGYQPLATGKILVRWDDRNRVDFASSGRMIDIFLESSIFNLSNGISFTKGSARAEVVLPLGAISLTPKFLIGAADKTLPGAELFSLGGQDVFFGMREDEERGRQIIVGNLDAQYKLPFKIIFDTYLNLRYDVGAVWDIPEKIRLGDLQHAIGGTVGFDTPIGPARFSVGRRFFFLDDPDAIAWGPFLGYFAIGVRL